MKLVLKVLLVVCLFVALLVVFSSCQCDHNYTAATCVSGKTCTLCGKVEGDPAASGGHKWQSATCLVAMKCELCGDMQGSKLGHNWKAATCQSPQKCTRCNMTQGSKKDHLWINATCDKPKTCDYCGQTSGQKLGHDWIAATCNENQTCVRCGDTTGKPLGHNWIPATCTNASTCERCNAKEGKALGHNYYGGNCQRCGIKDEDFLKINNSTAIYYLIGVPTAEIKVVDTKYKVSGNSLTIIFRVKKTYDILGSNHNEDYSFKWKLYTSSGTVIDSGTLYTESLRKNEYDDGFEIIIRNIDLGKKYRFEIISDSLEP